MVVRIADIRKVNNLFKSLALLDAPVGYPTAGALDWLPRPDAV